MKTILSAVLFLLATSSPGIGDPSESIKDFIENKSDNSRYKIDNEYILSGSELSCFYENRFYTPAWIIDNELSKNGYVLRDYICQVAEQGLQPEDYHLSLIGKYLEKMEGSENPDTGIITRLDILLSDAFVLLGSHLYYGKVDPLKEGGSWKIQRKEHLMQLDLVLDEALSASRIDSVLDNLAPRYRSYWMMKDQLAFFFELHEQLWPEIISDISIKPGDSNPLIPLIRARLIKLRYSLSDSLSMTFDVEMERQLKLFQDDWGLNSDGVIGKSTLEDLNSLPFKLISQLKVNMERLRWLPLQMKEKYIIVNIANFKLDLIDGQDTLISMRAIVGKELRETPVFNERISYIGFSPAWTVPITILQNDVIPELLKGPGYLEKKNMKLLRQDGSELVYTDVDWSVISKTHFPYTVRQSPGSGNALGRVKFMFPNPYDVYIHDTPSRGTFARDDRAVSSGCVRVEKPFDLAVLLLSDKPEWSPANIRSAMKLDKEQTVRLKIPVDVVLIYLTAWTDGNDRIQFRKDVYQRDEMILEALNQKAETIPVITIL